MDKLETEPLILPAERKEKEKENTINMNSSVIICLQNVVY